nr:MAG TPA: hypothetical protein [Bacteriophage sp.]
MSALNHYLHPFSRMPLKRSECPFKRVPWSCVLVYISPWSGGYMAVRTRI